MAFQQGDLNATLTLQDFMTRELKKSESSVKQFASRSRASLNKLGKAFLTLGGAVSAFGAARFLKSSIDAFTRQEKAVAGLEQVMKSMGRFTPELSQELQNLASQIQSVGISGDEAVIEGTKFLLTYKQIGDDVLPRTIRAMADLAALTGQDMAAAANIMGKAAMGMTGMLARYGITISDAVKESKDFVAILGEIEGQVKGQQQALRQTGFGGIEAFKNAWGDLKEEIGEVLTGTLLPVVKEVTSHLKTWKIATDENKKTMFDAFEKIAVAVGHVVDGVELARRGTLHFAKAALEARLALETGEETGWIKTINEGVRSIVPGMEAAHDAYDDLKEAIFGKEISQGAKDTAMAIVNLAEDIEASREKVSFADDVKTFFEGIRAEAEATKAAEEATKAQRAEIDKLVDGLLEEEEQLKRIQAHYDALAQKTEAVPPKIVKINKATNDYVGTMKSLQRFWDQVFETIEDSKKATDDFSDRARTFAAEWDLWYGKNKEKTQEILEIQDGLRSAFEGAASVIESSFIRALDESLEKGVQWRQLAQDILGDFSKMAISMAFKFGVSAASSAIFGAEKGGVFDGLSDRVPVKTYARGGVMGAQTEMAIMNEGRRREAVVPLPDNRSIPVKILDGGGRGDVHIHLDGVLDGQNAMAVLERHADGIMSIVNRKQQENPQRF